MRRRGKGGRQARSRLQQTPEWQESSHRCQHHHRLAHRNGARRRRPLEKREKIRQRAILRLPGEEERRKKLRQRRKKADKEGTRAPQTATRMQILKFKRRQLNGLSPPREFPTPLRSPMPRSNERKPLSVRVSLAAGMRQEQRGDRRN
ncbi:uncharacterized protein Tco025E_09066 [Trypanosoma conorhini]|uniref:Uncharacterized protein n=1 Tax=Trypanosoma conorhini TaxID=83891 RepID=A0A422N1B9_9TRYP|nr:uncharacterized protein Tco025E_09066 [Trypanosoma conorhini]RNE99255.1 hypothetical protein Tco025E_09066 [Trypanosoma conorhini]